MSSTATSAGLAETARAGHHSDAAEAGQRQAPRRIAAGRSRDMSVGQDRRDLQADDEGGADYRGDDLRDEARALRADDAKQRDRERDRERGRRRAHGDDHGIGASQRAPPCTIRYR